MCGKVSNIMRVFAEAEIGAGFAPRGAERHKAAASGTLNQIKQPPEPIEIVDISTHGCGFQSRWPFPVGARVWLRLPGLERWMGTIVWFDEDDGKGGVEFALPLHPGVAQRFARDIAANDG